jgi:hypothetical protein
MNLVAELATLEEINLLEAIDRVLFVSFRLAFICVDSNKQHIRLLDTLTV